MDRKVFIQQMLQEGKDREAVRRELISQGESTEGLEEEYQSIVQELGIKEPKPPVPDYVAFTANTVERHEEVPLPSIGKCLMQGVTLSFSKWRALILYSLLLCIPSVLFVLIPPAFMLLPVIIGVTVVGIFFSTVVSAAFVYTIVIADVHQATIADAMQWAIAKFFSFLWLSILSSLILLGSLVFFIVPFFAISLFNVFWTVCFIKEDAHGMRALLRSYDLIKGHFFTIGFYLLVFSVPVLLIGFLSSMLVLIPVPFLDIPFMILVQLFLAGTFLGALTVLYNACAHNKPLFDYSAYGATKWLYRLFAFLGLIALCVFGFLSVQSNPALLQSLPMNLEDNQQLFEGGEHMQVNFSNTLVISKVETTLASAKLYKGRMGFYDGVCEDITVVNPVVCRNTSTYFLIYAPLSESSVYCADSQGFKGEVRRPQEDRCQ